MKRSWSWRKARRGVVAFQYRGAEAGAPANDAELQIIDRQNRYRKEANDELSKVDVEMASLQETALGRQDTLERTELRSSVHGVVNTIRINTIGGVIQPGAEIMEITPLDDQLLVETKIKPSDVAFLAPGRSGGENFRLRLLHLRRAERACTKHQPRRAEK